MPRERVHELAEVLAVVAVCQPVRDAHQADAVERRTVGHGVEHERVVGLGVDEGDLDAMLDKTVGELHQRDYVALRGEGQGQDVESRHDGKVRSKSKTKDVAQAHTLWFVVTGLSSSPWASGLA